MIYKYGENIIKDCPTITLVVRLLYYLGIQMRKLGLLAICHIEVEQVAPSVA